LKVSPAGSVSVTVVVPDVARLPALPTAIVYVPVWPTANDPMCDFAIVSEGAPEIVVGSFAIGAFAAPPPLAVAVLVTDSGWTVGGTVTPRAIVVKAPAAAIAAVVVQVTTCPLSPHVQPAPTADANVRSAGKVSVTVVVPNVVALPVLVTAIEYEPAPPIGNVPVCDFAIANWD